MQFIAEEISYNSSINVMSQYHPCYKAFQIPELARLLSRRESLDAVELAHRAGLSRLNKVYSSLLKQFGKARIHFRKFTQGRSIDIKCLN